MERWLSSPVRWRPLEAMEIQDGLASGHYGLRLRIGINLGDLIVGMMATSLATGSTLLSGWRGSPIRAAATSIVENRKI